MDFQLSPALASALRVKELGSLSHELALGDLASTLADSNGRQAGAARILLAGAQGSTSAGSLLADIGAFLPFDSTVRDLATTGHLMKLLSRRAIYEKVRDQRIFGLPNELFDKISWDERKDFFKPGVCHTFDGDLFRIPEIVEMLARESRTLKAATS
jgi:hypothetical protein